MAVVNNQLEIPKKPIHTKVVGTTYENRQQILAAAEKHQVEFLLLEREPENEYDSDAIKVLAPVVDGEGRIIKKVQFGYIGNGERMCISCTKMMDRQTFARTRTVKCPSCGKLSQFARAGNFECPDCGSVFETDKYKTVTCPTCFGDEWTRDGLASTLARCMDAGIQFACQVSRDKDTKKLQYTGGEVDPKTKRAKSRGCNITITVMEATVPV